jgi:hypothetical protein
MFDCFPRELLFQYPLHFAVYIVSLMSGKKNPDLSRAEQGMSFSNIMKKRVVSKG